MLCVLLKLILGTTLLVCLYCSDISLLPSCAVWLVAIFGVQPTELNECGPQHSFFHFGNQKEEYNSLERDLFEIITSKYARLGRKTDVRSLRMNTLFGRKFITSYQINLKLARLQ